MLDMISDGTFQSIFARASAVGVGIELNFPLHLYEACDVERVLRPYRIAKAEGCKFYLGGDAHKASSLEALPIKFKSIIDALELEESDKFILRK